MNFKRTLVQFYVSLNFLPSRNHSNSPGIQFSVTSSQARATNRAQQFQSDFSKFNLNSMVLKEETNYSEETLNENHIICTTPEKWDAVTRSWKNNTQRMSPIRLLLIDDLLMLTENTVGRILEAVITRMKLISVELNTTIRLLAISTPISNAKEISEWLGGESTALFEFDHTQRPVQLETHVLGFPSYPHCSNYQFDLNLTQKLDGAVRKYSCVGKPTLIFCSTRKGVELTAQHLASTYAEGDLLHSSQSTAIATKLSRIHNTKLAEVIRSGVGYYHSGLPQQDRTVIEQLFIGGDLPILVTTSNNSGVAFTAYLVIIKSTNVSPNSQFINKISMLRWAK